MRKRVESEKYANMPVKYVGIMGIATRYSVGRATADKIARESGGIIRIGRRKLVNVEKADAYMAQKMTKAHKNDKRLKS